MVGFYVINKNTGNCAPASNVPFGFQIKKLEVLGGKLLINDKTYSLDLNIQNPVIFSQPEQQNNSAASDYARTLRNGLIQYYPVHGDLFYLYTSEERQF